MRRVQWPFLYGALGAVLIGTTVVSQVATDNAAAQRFGPNLATETLGIILTLVFVQRFLERQDRVRRLRSSLGALRRGSRALTRLIEAWATLIKGGLKNPPRYPPDSTLDLLEPHYTSAIAEIDPGIDGEGAPDNGWAAWAADEIGASRDALREVIRVYSTTLDAEYVEALDALLDDPFFDLFLDLADDPDERANDWQVRIRQAAAAREGHFRRLRALVGLHNDLAHEAANIRDSRRLPQTTGVGVDLPPDWDLRVHHAPSAGWWKAVPAPGSLRAAPRRTATR